MSDPDTATHLDPMQVLGRVGELLEATGQCVWAQAESEGPLSRRYTLAQDIHLTAALATGLVADGSPVPESGASADRPEPLEGLLEAESLLRGVPIEALPAGSSQLIVRLADLIREARG